MTGRSRQFVAAVAGRGRDETLGWESATAAATGARVGRREAAAAAAATRGGLGNFSGGVPDSGTGSGEALRGRTDLERRISDGIFPPTGISVPPVGL